jgi:hypothetical protein
MIGGMTWNNLAEDTVNWMKLSNIIVKYQGACNVGNFVTYWGKNSVLRKTLLGEFFNSSMHMKNKEVLILCIYMYI